MEDAINEVKIEYEREQLQLHIRLLIKELEYKDNTIQFLMNRIHEIEQKL